MGQAQTSEAKSNLSQDETRPSSRANLCTFPQAHQPDPQKSLRLAKIALLDQAEQYTLLEAQVRQRSTYWLTIKKISFSDETAVTNALEHLAKEPTCEVQLVEQCKRAMIREAAVLVTSQQGIFPYLTDGSLRSQISCYFAEAVREDAGMLDVLRARPDVAGFLEELVKWQTKQQSPGLELDQGQLVLLDKDEAAFKLQLAGFIQALTVLMEASTNTSIALSNFLAAHIRQVARPTAAVELSQNVEVV